MSDTGTPAEAPSDTLIEQDGAIPETVTPAEPTPEVPVEAEPEAPAAEATPEAPAADKPKRIPWYQTRIDEITRARRRAEQERDELLAKATSAPEPAEPDGRVDPSQFEELIEQRAEAKLVERQVKARTDGVMKAGHKEYGQAEFNEKCNEVAAMGAGDSREFMQIITDPDIIPDGHKLIVALADDPDEAERILALRNEPMKMAAALTRFASQAKAPETPVSKAPRPITPIGGTARVTAPADTDDIKAWMAKRNESAWDRKKAN